VSREREVKLAMPAGFVLPSLADPLAGIFEQPTEALELDATYYDTEDLRITRSGASIRRRNDEGWTVKLPATPEADDDGLVRDEHHFTDDGSPAPPDAALDLVRALARAAPVEPVARLRTTRRRTRLTALDGTQLAEVVDDRVEVVDGPPDSEPFREIEIEWTDAISNAQRTAVLEHFRSAAGVVDPTPKVVRALGPRATAPPDVVVPAEDRVTRVDDVVRLAIASCVAKIIAHDPRVRLGEDPEDVHQARVATRKLRSHLRTFEALVDERWATELRDELRWLGDVLGAVRDADVLLERLDRKVVRLPAVDRPAAEKLLDRLRSDLDRRRIQLLDALRSDRYLTLLDRLVLAARQPRLLLRVDDEPDAEMLRDLVRKPWKRLDNAVEALGDEPPDSALHSVRIDVKRARYAAEVLVPAFGKKARAFVRAMTDLQDVLGEHQDAVIAAEWLRATAAQTDDEAQGFAAGQLAGIEHHDSLTARGDWPAAWKRSSRRRLRDWL
jgi:CHAD domain-containing protein